jgi:GMP synthase-like glutamine amidotransferase
MPIHLTGTVDSTQAHAGQIPSADEASAFDALIIAGSHYSVNDDAQWIDDLASAVAQYAQRGVRMYGCCFGAQVGVSGIPQPRPVS